MRRYWPVLFLVVALLPSARLAWEFRDMPHLGQYHDDTIYWATAKSLADGAGYRIISLPEQPVQTKYPPLYPLFLAAVWKIQPSFPENLTTALWLQWLFLPFFLWLGRKMLLDLGIEPRWTWPLAAWMGFSTPVVLLSLSLMSDLPYCLALFGSLLLVSRAAQPGAPFRLALLAGLLAGVAYLTRTAALPLLVAAPIWLVARRRFGRAILFVCAVIPAVLWWGFWVRTHLHPSTDFSSIYYLDYVGFQRQALTWASLPAVASTNAQCLLAAISELLTSRIGESMLTGFFWRMFAFATLAGCCRLVRRSALGPYTVFGALLAALLLVCAWPMDSRQVVPLLPLFLGGLWTELAHLTSMIRRSLALPLRSTRAIAGLTAAAVAASCAAGVYWNSTTLFSVLPDVLSEQRSLQECRRTAYRWISANVPRNATFIAYDDVLLYLYTGRPGWSIRVSFLPYFQGKIDAFVAGYTAVQEFAQQHGATFLLATYGDYSRGEVPVSHLASVEKTVSEALAPGRIYESPGASVYCVGSLQARPEKLLTGRTSYPEKLPAP